MDPGATCVDPGTSDVTSAKAYDLDTTVWKGANDMAQWPSDEFLELKPPPFEPFIFVRTRLYMPTSIAMAAACGGSVKYLQLPHNTTADDLANVRQIVREHYREHRGGIPLWNEIEGYFFVFTPTDGILLDVDGNVIERRSGKYHPQSIAIQKEL
jgi:hypothetical protein